jgi:lysophospholipase L1-like esterase
MPSPFKNPELMVIGDSLAQGCRSLSVNAKFCKEGYPAIIAGEQGWDYNAPAFPRPVLFDLEDIVRNYVSPLGLILVPLLYAKVQKNLAAWCAQFASPSAMGSEWCDNLAVSGAMLEDMPSFRWSRSAATLAAAAGKDLLALARTDKDALANLHLAINSGFLLNPQGKAKYAEWDALRWVAERRPRRLVIHMGHNNGLYPIGSNAMPVDIVKTTVAKYLATIDAIEQATTKDQILIFILLPKISSVANLEVSGPGPDARGYWPRYKPVLSTSGLTFDAAGMRAMDDGIKAANIRIRARLEQLHATRNVRVIEAYDILETNDYKNSRDPKRQTIIGSTVVDNRYLTGTSDMVAVGSVKSGTTFARWRFDYGGFQSIDGMHPSAVGYGEVAIEIMKIMNWSYDKARIRKAALRNEALIGNFPVGLVTLRSVLDILRHKPEQAGGAPLPADGEPETDTAHTILAAQRCVFRT